MMAKRVDIPDAGFGFADIAVVVDGEVIRTFNSLSDDYALTNANAYVRSVNDLIARGDYTHTPMRNADGSIYKLEA